MPVVWGHDFIDFTSACINEKVEFVYDLLNAQMISASNNLEHEISSERE